MILFFKEKYGQDTISDAQGDALILDGLDHLIAQLFDVQLHGVATGIDTFLGVDPYTKGSTEVTELLQGEHGIKDWVEAKYTVAQPCPRHPTSPSR